MELFEKIIFSNCGDVSNMKYETSNRLLWDRSRLVRLGSRKADCETVWMLLWDRFRWDRAGKEARTRGWRTWRLLTLRSRWRRLSTARWTSSSVVLDRDLIVLWLKSRFFSFLKPVNDSMLKMILRSLFPCSKKYQHLTTSPQMLNMIVRYHQRLHFPLPTMRRIVTWKLFYPLSLFSTHDNWRAASTT